jgi:succinoglycan biosynthesis protein ExoA
MPAETAMEIRASVIVPCRNEIGGIRELLSFLLAVTTARDEIIVCDGRSDDGTAEAIREYAARDARIRFIDNPRHLASSALNLGIRAARGRYILRLDAHTRYAPDYIDACIAELERAGADNVGGPQLAEASGYTATGIALACHSPAAVGGSRIHDPRFEGFTDSVIYGCWRRELFDHVGLFDEELARNGDGEHNRRIRDHGGRIWQTPRIRSWYTPRRTLLTVARQYAQYGYWKAREMQRRRRLTAWRHAVPGAFVIAMIALVAAAPVIPVARTGLVALSATYAVFVAALSVGLCGRERSWSHLPVVGLAFVSMQMGYGSGFVAGIWDFWVRGGRGHPAFEKLTR